MTSPQRLPRIDKSALSEADRKLLLVSRMERWLQDFLLKPGNIERIPVHEGCHLYYFRQVHPNAKFVPPCIRYDAKGLPDPIKGAVDTKGMSIKCDENRLLMVAKAAACGGVAELAQLTTSSLYSADIAQLKAGKKPSAAFSEALVDIGDVDDLKDFGILCGAIRAANPELACFDIDELWKKAQSLVFVDLFDPQIRSAIDAVANEVKIALMASICPDTVRQNS